MKAIKDVNLLIIYDKKNVECNDHRGANKTWAALMKNRTHSSSSRKIIVGTIMVIPMQKSRFNVLHISDDDENDDGPFAKPKTRKAARPAANTTKPKKTVDVPFLVPNQPKKSRAKKPARSKQSAIL
uniref:Uncharacterized protein n=1 Tax=Romanomermis culicivorax TaxID=13658 RepID=A0A915HIW2_ROMCU